MRVTSEMMVTNSLQRLSSRLQQYERSQSQLATGKVIQRPSDDPAGANRGLSLRAMQRAREQEARNGADARSWLELADSSLGSAMQRLHRVGDLAVRGASAVDASERRAIASEIATVREELLSIANTTHRGRPLFAGYTDGPAVTEGSWATLGDEQVITRRVGESDVVPVNVTARDAFWYGNAEGDNVFALLTRLEQSLVADDGAAVGAALEELTTARNQLGDTLAVVGARANWVESAQRRGEEAIMSIRGEIAMVEDVDFAQAVMELQTQQVAYEATLQALARALPPSLAAFLR